MAPRPGAHPLPQGPVFGLVGGKTERREGERPKTETCDLPKPGEDEPRAVGFWPHCLKGLLLKPFKIYKRVAVVGGVDMGINYGKLISLAKVDWYPDGPSISFPVDINVDSGGKIPPLPTDIVVYAVDPNDPVDMSAFIQKLSTNLSTCPQVGHTNVTHKGE